MDNQEGYWVEDEEDGAEGFLEADDDVFWLYDEENYTWFQPRFQGRKMKRGFKGRRKGKGKKVAKTPEADASSRQGIAGRTLPMIIQMPGKQKDHGVIVNGKIPRGMIGPGTSLRSPMQPRAKGRTVRMAKEKVSTEKLERMERPAPRMEQRNLLMLPRAVQRRLLPQLSSLTTRTLWTFPVWPPKRGKLSSLSPGRRPRWFWI